MLKFPPELIVHKGNVFYLLYVVGGLLVTVTAGGWYVDVAVRTAQDPANLLRLSNTLIGLMGLRYQIHGSAMAKRKLKRLHFTDSFKSLLDMTRTAPRRSLDFKVICWFPVSLEKTTTLESTSANSISVKRYRIYYILICGGSSQPIRTLFMGNDSSELKTYNASNQLQWLINFSSEAQARGDVVFLLLGGQTGQISRASAINDATSVPTSLTVALSALSIVLLWMFLPHIAVCAVICLGWKVQQYIHQVLQSCS